MKRLIIALTVCLLLAGCTMDGPTVPTLPESFGHTDHTSPQARNRRSFSTETADDEGRTVYLVYNEPDGCVTRIAQIGNWEAPELWFEDNTVFFLQNQLCAVTFAGEQTWFSAPDIQVEDIIRVENGYVYCSANEGEIYLRIDDSLKNWEEISKEEAIA